MTQPVGGKRLRLIKQNFTEMIRQGLIDLGYMANDWRLKPVSVVGEPFDPSQEIEPNKIHVAGDDIIGIPIELGSGLEENRWTMYVDILAENDALGLSLAGDIRDIIRGKISSIGRIRPSLEILDYSQATPTEIFYVEFENIDLTKAQKYTTPVQKHWWVVACDVVDTYDTDEDA